MTEKVRTVIGCYFLLPDFKSHGHPNREGNNEQGEIVSLNRWTLKRYRKKNDIQYEFMYFHYINDQKKYETKTISEKKFLNYYAVKNDVHD